MRRRVWRGFAALAFLAAPALHAAPAPPESGATPSPQEAAGSPAPPLPDRFDPDSVLPFDPSLRTGTLANGVRYYVRRNTRPEERAELRLVVNAGSVLEDEDQRGLAHFVEHMAFNGTQAYPRLELVRWLESIGMRFGPDVNAYTSFDETVYMLTVPTDSADLLARGLDVLAQWAGHVTLDAAEIERERGVVIEEWRLGRGAFARMLDEQLPVVLKDSRYAERLPIGEVEVLRGFEPDAARRFYREWYRPDLMAVIAVGDFDPERVEAAIRERFSPLRSPETPRPRPLYEVPDHPEPLFALASDPEASRTEVAVYFKQPMRVMRTAGDYRQRLVEELFSSMLNARFEEIARRPDPPFLGASTGQGRLVRSREVFALSAVVDDSGIERGLATLLAEAERVDRHGFTPSEIARHKVDLLRAYERAYAEREKSESEAFAAEYGRAFLEEEPVPGIAYEYALVRRLLPGIELAEVNRLAREWITEENRVLVVSAPEREGAGRPGEEALAAVFDSVRGVELGPWVDEEADRPLVATPPAPGEIVEERRRDAIGVVEWRLSNGVRVLLRPTAFKDDEVVLRATSPGGTSLAGEEWISTAANAAALVAYGGVGTFDQVALQKKLAGKAVTVTPFLDDLREGFSGSASPRDLETMLQLVWLYASAPRADTAAFLSIRQRILSLIENRSASPEAHFQDTLTVAVADRHPRVRPMTTETVEGWDLGRAFEFFRDRFGDASDFTFAIVGSFDADSIRPLVRTWLGGLPAGGREESWRDTGVDPPAGVVRKVVRKGIEPKSQAAIVFGGTFPFSRENAFAFEAMGVALDIVLRERLREELGGTYGAQVSAVVAAHPDPEYSLRIQFGADPERLEELTGVALAEVRRLANDGPSEDVLSRVREQLRRSRETAERTNGFWASQLLGYDWQGWPLEWIPRYGELVDALGEEDVAEMARLLDPGRYVEVSLLPEGDAPVEEAAPTEGEPAEGDPRAPAGDG